MSHESVNSELDNGTENFEELLNHYSPDKEFKNNEVIKGEIVEINENDGEVLISIGGKREPRFSITEIQDKNGKLLFKKGDTINVVIVKRNGPQVSYKKYIEQEKTRQFIEDHGGENLIGFVVDGNIKAITKNGYWIEQNGVTFYMPHTNAFLTGPKKSSLEKRRLQDDRKVRAKITAVDSDNNRILISRKRYIRDEIKKRQHYIEQAKEADAVQGRIIKIYNDKLILDLEGVTQGIIFVDEVSHRGKVNLQRRFRVGDVVEAKVIDYNEEERVLILSIKATTVDPWLEIQEQIEKGDIIEVTVTNIEHYGAFVDVGNEAEGFLHISEIAWDKKIAHPSDHIKVGDIMEVEVIEVDPDAHRLRVSRKKMLPKPFELFRQKYSQGDIVSGLITNLTDFGAFIRIDQVEGLLRNQDLDWNRGTKCKDILKKGDEVKVKIINIDVEREKISLSRKALLDTPVQLFAKTHRVGNIINGTIRDIKEFGVFVTIGENVDALIRNEDMPPQFKEELTKGQEIEGMIIALDTRRDRIRLSIRRLEKAKEQQLLKAINAQNDDNNNSLGDLLKEKLK